MKILYQTSATATGGRTGTATVDDGSLTLFLTTPRSWAEKAAVVPTLNNCLLQAMPPVS